MIEISIIIVNYKTAKLTCNCIDSIKKYSSAFNFEIIVIENGSNDFSGNFILTRHPEVILIESPTNIGFGPANNLGSKIAKGEYLFFLNSDTIFIEDSLKIITKHLNENSRKNNINVLGFNLIDDCRLNHFSFGNFPTLKQELFEFGLKKVFKGYFNKRLSPSCSFDKNENEAIEVDYIVGADFLISRAAFNFIGGFDEDFFLYYEETELCYRLKKNGYKIFCSPITKIVHLCGQSSKIESSFNEWLFIQMSKSKWLFFEKCYGRKVMKIVKILDRIKQPLIYKSHGPIRIYKILKSI